jgi:DNA repair protein RecO (recombination protein O)
VFSKHYGKMFIIAKGVRRTNSRKRGHIEIFSRVKYSYIKDNNYSVMNEAELINSYGSIRASLKKTSLAYYLIEVISKIIQEEEKHEDLYNTLLRYFDLVESERRLKELRYRFIYDVLVSLGYWPKDKIMDSPDKVIESVLERQINSKRVGEKMLL